MKNKTLLQKFISENLANYVEPQRKGTPKGGSIGLSRRKYHATLLMLTNEKMTDIAVKLKLSYGLFKKWHTEYNFRSQIEKNATLLAEQIFKALIHPDIEHPYIELIDSQIYSDVLIQKVLKNFREFVRSSEFSVERYTYLNPTKGQKINNEVLKKIVHFKQQLIETLADNLRAILKTGRKHTKIEKELLEIEKELYLIARTSTAILMIFPWIKEESG